MQFESIKLETSPTETPGIHVLKVSGEIDVYTAPEFRSAMSKAISAGAMDLIVDLTNVDYMDSSGFGSLLGATRRIRQNGGGISLTGCSEAIQRMLRITRLNTVFRIFETPDDALASLTSEDPPA